MSQKVSRKAAVTEDKEKRQTDSPVKEMKKKMAANTEKQPAEKSDKSEKPTEKVEKNDKPEKSEKKEKAADKKESHDKNKEESSSKEDKAKSDKEKPTPSKEDPKPKQNGQRHNGVAEASTNGDDVTNGTVSADEDDDVMLVIDDHDDMFPELTYDDNSDVDFEPPTPEATSRSLTRRSQPSKDSKLLKLKDDLPTDRKLRSADSPKPEGKKDEEGKKDAEGKKDTEGKKDEGKKDKTESPKKTSSKDAKVIEVTDESKEKDVESKQEENKTEDKEGAVKEGEGNDGSEDCRKTDTNFSKSRVKVSPYRRSMRLADQTNTSLQANYTGNNTTMEMDITESTSFLEDATEDSSYLRGLRSIRGRSSYKPLHEMNLRHISHNNSATSTTTAHASHSLSSRPTAPVVGRKRKPDSEDTGAGIELAQEAGLLARKRLRVLERLAEPFRRVLPAVGRRNAEIVGINSDLPLSAPALAPALDPESLKPPAEAPVAVPLPPHDDTPHNKRCVVM